MTYQTKSVNRIILIITIAIAAVCLIGVGYSAWNDSLKIVSSVDTGKIKVSFCEEPLLEAGGNSLTAGFKDASKTVMEITGEAEGLTLKQLWFYVENNGTLPVKLKEVKNPLSINVITDYCIINPGEKSSVYYAEFYDELDIVFVYGLADNISWTKELTVEGQIKVIEPDN